MSSLHALVEWLLTLTELELLHVRLTCLYMSQMVFFGGRNISRKAILVDFEVAIYHASSIFRCLGYKFGCGIWIPVARIDNLGLEYPQWAPLAAFGGISDHRWLSLLILVNIELFCWTWRDISNFLIYNVLRIIMCLIASINIWWLNVVS